MWLAIRRPKEIGSLINICTWLVNTSRDWDAEEVVKESVLVLVSQSVESCPVVGISKLHYSFVTCRCIFLYRHWWGSDMTQEQDEKGSRSYDNYSTDPTSVAVVAWSWALVLVGHLTIHSQIWLYPSSSSSLACKQHEMLNSTETLLCMDGDRRDLIGPRNA